MRCCGPSLSRGLSVPPTPSPIVTPSLLVLADTIEVADTNFVDFFAGQAAPEPATCIVPAMARGGVAWDVYGTLGNTGGPTDTFRLELQCSFGGVVVYRGRTALFAGQPVRGPWRSQGRITRKDGETMAASIAVQCTIGNRGSADVGLGIIADAGNLMSPSLPLGGDELACDWSVANQLVFAWRWVSIGTGDQTFDIRGGEVWLFGETA